MVKNRLVCKLFELLYYNYLTYDNIKWGKMQHTIVGVWSWRTFSYDYCGRITTTVIMPWEEDYKIGNSKIGWLFVKLLTLFGKKYRNP